MRRLSIFSLSIVVATLSVLFIKHQAHAAIIAVTTNADSGAGSLRQAITDANTSIGVTDTIDFNIAGAGVHTITLLSALPAITDPVTIDGSTQPGASCGTLVPTTMPGTNTPHTLTVEIDGGGQAINLITLGAGSGGTEIKGLVLNNATGSGIVVAANSIGSLTIDCNYIGTNSAGTATGNLTGQGVSANFITNTITIQNNLISGTSTAIGINSNVMNISGNLIGTDVNGTSAIANTGAGVTLYSSSNSTVNHNVVSGNGSTGVGFDSGSNMTFTGNVIGLGIDGNALGNNGDGVRFFAVNNFTIGGVSSAQRNIISANTGNGLHIYNNCDGSPSQSIGSTTYNNYIGTQMDGSVKTGFGNSAAGIEVNEYYGGCVSVYKHIIGGDAAGQANIIAGNINQGILIHQGSGYDVFSITTIGNSIYANGQFGIDLASDSDNDSGIADTDLGPNVINNLLMSYPAINANYYINRPTINSTSVSGNQLTVNYDYQANGVVASGDGVSLLPTDLVGYRLDFYLNNGTQDGAYPGYAQGRTHLSSFIVNGSETNATHTFTSPINFVGSQNATVTSTVLWQNIPDPPNNCGNRAGAGPPYYISTNGCG